MHFRIEVEGVEAHASTRYLSVHAGGKGGGGVNAIEKTIKVIVALQELEREWANTKSHPILPPGYDTLSPTSSSAARAAAPTAGSTCSRTPARAELLLGRVQPLVLSGRDARGREGARSRTSSTPSAAPIRGCASIRRGSRGSSGTSTSRRSTCRSTTPRSQTLADCLAAVGLDPAPQGFGAATDLAWYGERKPPRDHLRARPTRAVPRRRRVPRHEPARPRREGVRPDARRLVRRLDQTVVCPPSTARSWPVMWRAPVAREKERERRLVGGLGEACRAGSRAATRPRCRG